jgi:Zn-dependent protease with chaperone function
MNFFHSLWLYLGKLGAPPVPEVVVVPVPPPAVTQDQFPATPAAFVTAKEQDQVVTRLYDRVVRANNAYVTRDFGSGPVVITNDTSVPILTDDEITQLAGKRTGVKVVVPVTRPKERLYAPDRV